MLSDLSQAGNEFATRRSHPGKEHGLWRSAPSRLTAAQTAAAGDRRNVVVTPVRDDGRIMQQIAEPTLSIVRSADAVTEIRRELAVLDRIGRACQLDREARTAVRVRMMALIDRLEIEQAKQRIVEGNFHAARYYLNAAHHRPWRVRAAQVALNVAPRLVRAAYLRLRPAEWPTAERAS
jgi:hypothetical protein